MRKTMKSPEKFKIGKNSRIKANTLQIADDVVIGDNVNIVCNKITIGPQSIIKNNVKITCTEFHTGAGLYMCDNVEIGRGGCNGPSSKVLVGNNVGIFENTIAAKQGLKINF